MATEQASPSDALPTVHKVLLEGLGRYLGPGHAPVILSLLPSDGQTSATTTIQQAAVKALNGYSGSVQLLTSLDPDIARTYGVRSGQPTTLFFPQGETTPQSAPTPSGVDACAHMIAANVRVPQIEQVSGARLNELLDSDQRPLLVLVSPSEEQVKLFQAALNEVGRPQTGTIVWLPKSSRCDRLHAPHGDVCIAVVKNGGAAAIHPVPSSKQALVKMVRQVVSPLWSLTPDHSGS